MQSKKLFLSIMILFILASFPFINAVGASSELWSQTYGGASYDTAQSVVETSDGGYILAGAVDSVTPVSDWWVVRTDGYGIPEFPSWAILPLLIVATLVVMLYKQRLPKTSSK